MGENTGQFPLASLFQSVILVGLVAEGREFGNSFQKVGVGVDGICQGEASVPVLLIKNGHDALHVCAGLIILRDVAIDSQRCSDAMVR